MNDEKLIKEISDEAIQLMADWPSSRNKQKRFILEYVATGFTNASEAARNAGYSKKTANKVANNMLSGVDKYGHIKPITEKLQSEYDKRQAELKIADGTEVMQYLTSLMRGEQTEKTVISVGDFTQEITDIDVSAKDRIKAAELLGKRYGIWTDKTELTGEPDIEISITIDYGDANGD